MERLPLSNMSSSSSSVVVFPASEKWQEVVFSQGTSSSPFPWHCIFAIMHWQDGAGSSEEEKISKERSLTYFQLTSYLVFRAFPEDSLSSVIHRHNIHKLPGQHWMLERVKSQGILHMLVWEFSFVAKAFTDITETEKSDTGLQMFIERRDWMGRRNGLEEQKKEPLPRQQLDKRNLSPGQKCNLSVSHMTNPPLFMKIKRGRTYKPAKFLRLL